MFQRRRWRQALIVPDTKAVREMLEKIITSKTRVKILKLFLTNMDNRYYLRELERKLDESLSPLRRQLVKLVKMGILVTEEEANLKYYRLNKDFTGMEELRRIVLGTAVPGRESRNHAEQYAEPMRKELGPVLQPQVEVRTFSEATGVAPVTARPSFRTLKGATPKRVRYDVLVLTVVSLFVLATAMFVVHTSNKNIRQVASLISEKTMEIAEVTSQKITKPVKPGEMVSRQWKVLPGHVPVLSSGETGGGRRNDEL